MPCFRITLLRLLVVALMAMPSACVHICGNYCGPDWCNGQVLDEAKCDDSAPVETHSLTGPSCGDSCCKMHDTCCGHGERSTCNKAIVDCLAQCDKLSATCTLDGVPVPAGAIEAAMDIVEDWCCGERCPGEDIAQNASLVQKLAILEAEA
jgi:hypothetical protein